MKNKYGFVLLEAIVVITVLSVILVMLYGAYSKILIDVKKQSLYDNTEYIYKTNIVRDIVEKEETDENIINYKNNVITTYCSDFSQEFTNCSEKESSLGSLGVRAVYITEWNVTDENARSLEATTQRYIKSIDEIHDESLYRIIVMFNQENNESGKPIYEYASLRFGSRG